MQPNDDGIHPSEDQPPSSPVVPPLQPVGGVVVRWTGPEIVLVLLVGLVCQGAAYAVLDSVGLFRWFYGGDGFREVVREGGAEGQLALSRIGLWVGVLAGSLQVLLALAVLRTTAGATPADLGLTTHRLRRNVLAGLVLAVVFAPGAYAIQYLVLLLMGQLGGTEQPHPFTLLGQQPLHPAEWLLLVAAAVLVAPLWEELFYRGILQPWVMARQPWGGPAVLATALVLTAAVRADSIWAAAGQGAWQVLLELLPLLTLLMLLAAYPLLERYTGSPEVSGLFATAVLFAWVHARVWPSPIPLLWLALGLGWLRWKGGSILGCIVLHAVFNGIACVLLLAGSSGR